MKRLWICGIALLTTAALVSTTAAQSGRAGSYQEILGQAGYQGNSGFVPTQGFPAQGFPIQGIQQGIPAGTPVYPGVSMPGQIGGQVSGGSGTIGASSISPGTIQGSVGQIQGTVQGTIQGTVQSVTPSTTDAAAATTGADSVITPPAGAVVVQGDEAIGQYAPAVNGGVVNGAVAQGWQNYNSGAITGPVYTDPGYSAGAIQQAPVYVPGQFQAAPLAVPQFIAAPQRGGKLCSLFSNCNLFKSRGGSLGGRLGGIGGRFSGLSSRFSGLGGKLSGLGGRSGYGGGGGNRNVVYGISGLIFDRDFEDDVVLSRQPSGRQLLSTDADTGNLSGVEGYVQSRNASGTGFEARYWGLFSDPATASLRGPLATQVQPLSRLTESAFGFNVYSSFNLGDVHTITRSNEIHNAEFNFLKNLGQHTGPLGLTSTNEVLFGFRWFNFDEGFSYQSDSTVPTYAPTLAYNIDVENTLIGLQAGMRSEACITKRVSFAAGLKFGLFNNRIRRDQNLQDGLGNFATIRPGGPAFNFNDSKDDLSTIGELDLAAIYQINCRTRARIGYRALGITGIALAPDQIPLNFDNETAVRDIQSNGSLLLHGAYAGLEFAR